MDSARSPNDPSAYFESLMQAGQQSVKQFDDAMADAMGVSKRGSEEKASSPLVAAAELQRDSVLQFWRFRLVRHSGGTLHITRGLLTSRESSIEEKRIRGLEVGEPLGLRLVGGGRLHVITTGLSKREDRRGTAWLVPPAPRQVVAEVAAAVVGDRQALTARLTHHGASARRRRYIRAMWPALAILLVALLLTLWRQWPIGIAVAAFTPTLLMPFIARDRYAGLGHHLTPEHLVVRSGSFVRRRDVVQRTGIIGWNVRSSWFQRRVGLAH